jgi:hypothetical protein
MFPDQPCVFLVQLIVGYHPMAVTDMQMPVYLILLEALV